MTEIWLGMATVREAHADGRLTLTGDAELARHMQVWLGLSPFAKFEKAVA